MLNIKNCFCYNEAEERYKELNQKGVKIKYQLYPQNNDLMDVALYYYPSDNPIDDRFVLILPGGGYSICAVHEEGYAIAARLNKMGYTAFVLKYRTRNACKDMAMIDDVKMALEFIADKANKFCVDSSRYALMGFSAGGNLAGLFGTEKFGFSNYGAPKPQLLILCYPWLNINGWYRTPKLNPISNRNALSLQIAANNYIKPKHKDYLDVPKWVTKNYPPTYMWAGMNDTTVVADQHASVMEKALKKNGVKYKYEIFRNAPHGIGLAENTDAENWLNHAIEFWNMLK